MQADQAEQKDLLSSLQDARTALDIISHGKVKRAEAVQLCPLCMLQGKTECPYPDGKTGCCEGYALSPSTTLNQVLNLIKS